MVTISGVKKYIKTNIFRSMRFQIALIICFTAVASGFLMKGVLLKSYEKRAVEVRTAEIQNQCTILCNQLGKTSYYTDDVSVEVIESEFSQLSNIYDGRVMAIDSNYRVVEDTYDMDIGKTIVSDDVIKCFNGNSTSFYDSANKYIEVTSPIYDSVTKEVKGVLLVCISTDVIEDSLTILDWNANTAGLMLIAIMIGIAVLVGYLIVRPFRKVTKSIEAVAEGHETDFLQVNAYNETRRISEAFNKMLTKMKVLDDSRNEFVSNAVSTSW